MMNEEIALTKQDREPDGKTEKLGVRERSKRERQDRIMMAARTMFAEHGYDATTLRQVAERAGLGLGTLFNYISDKRDLIYLVFNREVSLVTDVSLAAPRPLADVQRKDSEHDRAEVPAFWQRTGTFTHTSK